MVPNWRVRAIRETPITINMTGHRYKGDVRIKNPGTNQIPAKMNAFIVSGVYPLFMYWDTALSMNIPPSPKV